MINERDNHNSQQFASNDIIAVLFQFPVFWISSIWLVMFSEWSIILSNCQLLAIDRLMKLHLICIWALSALLLCVRSEIHLNFRINLQPFSFALPRFKLPPIRISADFLPPPHDEPPSIVTFPGVTISGQNNHNEQQETSYYHHQSQVFHHNDHKPRIDWDDQNDNTF